jgi:predicted DNA-binding transcriptional regulator YafY
VGFAPRSFSFPRQAGPACVELLLPFGKQDYAHVTPLGFGVDIEVLEPGELRSLMVATAAAVAALCTERQPA